MHIGVNLAIVPNKGLTLPLMSYGGSSLMMTLIAMALLMRVYRETQTTQFGVSERKATTMRSTQQALTKRTTTIRRTVRGT